MRGGRSRRNAARRIESGGSNLGMPTPAGDEREGRAGSRSRKRVASSERRTLNRVPVIGAETLRTRRSPWHSPHADSRPAKSGAPCIEATAPRKAGSSPFLKRYSPIGLIHPRVRGAGRCLSPGLDAARIASRRSAQLVEAIGSRLAGHRECERSPRCSSQRGLEARSRIAPRS